MWSTAGESLHSQTPVKKERNEKKQPGNVSRSCKCDGMSWTYAGLSFIHLILPPASCCVWINKRHHGNWNCPKKKKEKKNTIKTRWLHASASRRRSGKKNNPFLHDCDEKHHNRTLYFTCASYVSTSAHAISRERKEWRSIYKYNMIYKRT